MEPVHPRGDAATSVAALGTIVSLWAHPDDETYLAGGVMALARHQGQRVVCASATAGEHGTTDPEAWPPARLGQVRRWEAAAAMAVLGVSEHTIGGLPDGCLAAHHDRGRRWARQLLEQVAPDTILTFGADGRTFHPDHVAVHRWVTAAWHELGQPGQLLYATTTPAHLVRFAPTYEAWDVYMTHDRPVGTPPADLALHLHLDGPVLDRKLTALRAMATQTADLAARLDPATFAALVAEEAFVAAPTG